MPAAIRPDRVRSGAPALMASIPARSSQGTTRRWRTRRPRGEPAEQASARYGRIVRERGVAERTRLARSACHLLCATRLLSSCCDYRSFGDRHARRTAHLGRLRHVKVYPPRSAHRWRSAPRCVCGACTASDNKQRHALAHDTALNRDLQLAASDTRGAAAAAGRAGHAAGRRRAGARADAPRRPAPRRQHDAARPTPHHAGPPTTTTPLGQHGDAQPGRLGSASGGGAVGTIAVGHRRSACAPTRASARTPTRSARRFTATVANAVTRLERRDDPGGRHGDARGHAAQAQRERERQDHHGVRGQVGDVRRQDLSGRAATVADADVDRVRNQPKSKDVQKVVGGAVVGAITGQILGKNTKSTVIGAAAGAAAGAARRRRRRTTRAASRTAARSR